LTIKKENTKLMIGIVVALCVGFIIGLVITGAVIGNAVKSVPPTRTLLVKNVDSDYTPCGLCFYTGTWLDGSPVDAIAECYLDEQGACKSCASECKTGCAASGTPNIN
jgi:hypothetical protein